MSEKSEVEKLFKIFYSLVETQFQTKIAVLHTDNGTKYFNEVLGSFLKEKGIHHQSNFFFFFLIRNEAFIHRKEKSTKKGQDAPRINETKYTKISIAGETPVTVRNSTS